MTTQHTPGPWTTDGAARTGDLDVISPAGRITLIDCEFSDESEDVLTANARLIAAAPDLLNMLRNAENWFREYDVQNGPDSGAQLLLEDIRAAIDKAMGAA
jgi:hypothetical protein